MKSARLWGPAKRYRTLKTGFTSGSTPGPAALGGVDAFMASGVDEVIQGRDGHDISGWAPKQRWQTWALPQLLGHFPLWNLKQIGVPSDVVVFCLMLVPAAAPLPFPFAPAAAKGGGGGGACSSAS